MAGRRRFIRLPAFNGVGLGQTPTLNLPLGDTYHNIWLRARTSTASKKVEDILEYIRLKANGREIQNWTKINHWKVYNEHRGISWEDDTDEAHTGEDNGAWNVLTIDRPRLRMREAQEVTSLPTGVVVLGDGQVIRSPVQTLTLECKVKGSGVAGVELEAYAEVSDPELSGAIKKIRTFNYPLVNGVSEISDLPRLDLIDSITLHSANVRKLRFGVDQYTVWERTKVLNKRVTNQMGTTGRAMDDDYFCVDFAEQGFGAEAMPTVDIADMRLYVTSSAAAANCPIVVEYIGGLEQ